VLLGPQRSRLFDVENGRDLSGDDAPRHSVAAVGVRTALMPFIFHDSTSLSR
jgi:hypothetical protein